MDYSSDLRPLLTPAELARRLKLNKRTVIRLADTGCLPGAAKFGRSWRFDSRRIDELFRATA